MGNSATPVNKYSKLAAYFRRKFSKIPCEFRADYFTLDLPPINPLKRVEVASLEP
jgi:hypothetical protein